MHEGTILGMALCDLNLTAELQITVTSLQVYGTKFLIHMQLYTDTGNFSLVGR
jgi:hypothetical protein